MFKKKATPKSAPSGGDMPEKASNASPQKGGFRLLPGKRAAVPPAEANTPAGATIIGTSDDEFQIPTKSPKKGGAPLGLVTILVLLLALGAGGYYAYTTFLGGTPIVPEAATIDSALAPIPTEAAPDTSAVVAPEPTKGKKKANKAKQTATAAENSGASGQEPSAAVQNPPPAADNGALQALLRRTPGCGGQPPFLAQLGLGNDVQFSTNEPGTRGLFVIGTNREGGAPTKYQHQSWSSAGYLDAFVIDAQGNLYLAPSPRTGPGVPAPMNQEQIFRLAGTNGLLTPLIELPAAAPPAPENPYGVLGLALDCSNNTLYATSVGGSTPDNQVGRIFQIDTATGQVIGQLDNLDAYGVAVRTTDGGKQLYFGSPRDALIRAIDLDTAGNFQGEPRPVATLADPQRARRIVFGDAGEMVVEAVPFDWANAEIPQGAAVLFQYDPATDTWNPAQ